MGFVAVFSGATHTPIACTIMGIELFGTESTIYIAIACFTAYFCSGSVGIYSSQIIKGPKYILYQKWRKTILKICNNVILSLFLNDFKFRLKNVNSQPMKKKTYKS